MDLSSTAHMENCCVSMRDKENGRNRAGRTKKISEGADSFEGLSLREARGWRLTKNCDDGCWCIKPSTDGACVALGEWLQMDNEFGHVSSWHHGLVCRQRNDARLIKKLKLLLLI